MYKGELSLYDSKGNRKYLNSEERQRFYNCTLDFRQDHRLFCQILFFTGARISEVFHLRASNIDFSNKTIVFRTLKQRGKAKFREIPVPLFFLEELRTFLAETTQEISHEDRLWHFSIRSASRCVKRVMLKAEIDGIKSTAKGLRHGFAVHAITKVPITLVKKWLGHSRLETTEIYLNVVGFEERSMARRLWDVELDLNTRH